MAKLEKLIFLSKPSYSRYVNRFLEYHNYFILNLFDQIKCDRKSYLIKDTPNKRAKTMLGIQTDI